MEIRRESGHLQERRSVVIRSCTRPSMAAILIAPVLAQHYARHEYPQANALNSTLKQQLAALNLLVPDSELPAPLLHTARAALEHASLAALAINDLTTFDRTVALLPAYYSLPLAPLSSLQPTIESLLLLRLLSQNRIAQFHTLLETLTPTTLASRPAQWTIHLERSLMEGSYSKVWKMCHDKSLPVPELGTFLPSLLETVREEIGSCCEKGYDTLEGEQARMLLFFDTTDQVVSFGKQVRSLLSHLRRKVLMRSCREDGGWTRRTCFGSASIRRRNSRFQNWTSKK